MTSSNGINVGDPVKYRQNPSRLGKVTKIIDVENQSYDFIEVRHAVHKHVTAIFLPDELEICRCVNRTPLVTPMSKVLERA